MCLFKVLVGGRDYCCGQLPGAPQRQQDGRAKRVFRAIRARALELRALRLEELWGGGAGGAVGEEGFRLKR